VGGGGGVVFGVVWVVCGGCVGVCCVLFALGCVLVWVVVVLFFFN
jgi:hypothetical protein